ncbi:hypothetical protein [Nonomuraea dietziae]
MNEIFRRPGYIAGGLRPACKARGHVPHEQAALSGGGGPGPGG